MFNKRAWSIWIVATLFVAFQLFVGILFGISTKELSSALSISGMDVSNIVAIYFLAYACMQIPAGFIIDRVSIKYTLLTASILIVVGLIILGITHSLLFAYLAAILMGFASSFCFVAAVVLIGRWFNPKMFSVVVGMTSGANGLMASLICYIILSVGPVLHINYIILTAVLGIIISVLILLIVKDYPKETELIDIEKTSPNILTAIYKSVCNTQIFLASIITALIYGSMLSFITFWNIQYQELYGNDLVVISLLNITALAGIAIGAPLFGLISEKVGKRKPVGMGICIGLFLSLMILLQPVRLSLPVVFIAMFLIGFFANNVSIGFSIVKENSSPQFIGTSIAYANTILFLGLSLFNILPGGISNFLHMHRHFSIGSYISKDISFMSIALYIYPLAAIVALILHFFIKETNCRSRGDLKK